MIIRPHIRNRKKENDFLRSDDISECPCCGNWNMWHGLGKDGYPSSIVCTECGWVCGNAKFIEAVILRYEEIKLGLKKKMAVRGEIKK